jgi:hypothetical protein
LLPLSLGFNAMHLETITPETRIDLLRTAFFLVWKLYGLKSQGVDTNPEKTSRRRETNNLHIGMGGPFLEHCFLISFLLELIINEINEIPNEQKSQCSNNIDSQRSNQTIRVIQRRNM